MTYFGGKAQDGVYQAIINQIPMHDRYIELFLGGGAIMLKKKPARYSFGYDLDERAVLAFPYLPRTEVFHADAFMVLSTIDENTFDGSTFIYADPPYPLSSIRGRSEYRHKLSDNQHIDLLDRLIKFGVDIMISTYPNEIYSEILKDWRLLEFNSVSRAGQVTIEQLYMNYDPPKILHDDSYLGKNANGRQDIKRRIARTKKRLLSWNSHERQKLLLEMLAELPEFERKRLCEQLLKN